MASWLRNWFGNLTQTRKFHPSWILIGVVVSAFLAALIWGAAVLLARAEADDLRPVETPVPAGVDAIQEGGAPVTIPPPAVPRETPQKTIQVRFPPPAAQWERIPAAATPAPMPWARPLRRVS